jgi:hypothetical protein
LHSASKIHALFSSRTIDTTRHTLPFHDELE